MITFRVAQTSDAATLLAIKGAAWPEEEATMAQIERGLAFANQLTLLGLMEERPVGFASSFPTYDSNGQRYWNLDLLAVHPDARGQRLGTRLVEESHARFAVPSGEWWRALIATSNVASQIAFSRMGYRLHEDELGLYVAELSEAGTTAASEVQAHLVPVETLNYGGYWLESLSTESALFQAAGIPATEAQQIVGALLPVDRPELTRGAEAAGYHLAGNFQWWHYQEK